MEHPIVISSDRQTGEKTWSFPAQRVYVPEFEIYANPTINIADIKARRYSLMERYKSK